MNFRATNLQSRRRQAGMTTLGMIILAIFVGLFAFGTIRLIPVYMNYLKIAGVIDGVHTEFDGKGPTSTGLKTSIRRRFDVESVGVITARDVAVTSVDGGFEISAVYDHTSPFIANVSFTVHFNKTVLVRR